MMEFKYADMEARLSAMKRRTAWLNKRYKNDRLALRRVLPNPFLKPDLVLPRGFDVISSQPDPFTSIRIGCRRCLASAMTDKDCEFCSGRPIRAMAADGWKVKVDWVQDLVTKKPPKHF